MTREEAIAELREDKALYESDICHAGDGTPDGRLLQALDMAIEALSADAVSLEFYEDAVKANIGLVIENRKLKEQIESAEAVQGEWIVREYCTNELDYRRWIEIECPFCGEKPTYEDLDNMNYCPNCGAKMKGGAE